MTTKTIDEIWPWEDYTACQYLDNGTTIFFEDDSDETPKYFYPYEDTAKAICEVCPVKQECLDHAMEVWEEWGIWGGLTFPERRKLRRQMEKDGNV